MQVIGIQKRSGEFQGRQYENYNLSILVTKDEFGNHTKNLKIKKSALETMLKNHKMADVKNLLGFEFSNEYYDAYRNLVDLA